MEYMFGLHAVKALLEHQASSIKEIYFTMSTRNPRLAALESQAKKLNCAIQYLPSKELSRMVDGHRHQGVVVALAASAQPKPTTDLFGFIQACDEPLFLLVLDGVQDPHNLGACLRSADAAGVDAVIAPKDKSAGLTSVVRKVACGAAETVPFFQVTNLARTLQQLKDYNIWIIGADADGEQALYKTDFTTSIALVLGAEGSGLRRLTKENCDQCVTIPMHGSVESLNVSVAASIMMYEVVRQRQG
ncbi:MAG: 23S rRNA (guanosine(2251)-2'-O)-methyltransferase RlmB [Gammaproteobacteria bacterium]